jgi:hypothetical protein
MVAMALLLSGTTLAGCGPGGTSSTGSAGIGAGSLVGSASAPAANPPAQTYSATTGSVAPADAASSATRYATFLFPVSPSPDTNPQAGLRTYSPSADPTFPLYQDLPPLAPRVSRTDIYHSSIPSNMGVLNYDSRAGQNPKIIGATHGQDRALFEGWNFVDIYSSFAGDSVDGPISLPTPQEISIGHKNGVVVLGSLMFPPAVYGGRLEWEQQLVGKDADGKYWAVEKLLEVAKAFHFDGWFFNTETTGLSPEEVVDYQAVMEQLKARGLIVIWYDSLNPAGSIDYQNELNSENLPFLTTSSGFFANYDWGDEQLSTSADTAGSRASAVYMGIGWWPDCCGADEPIPQLKALSDFDAQRADRLSSGLWACEWPITGTTSVSVPECHLSFARSWWPSGTFSLNPQSPSAAGDLLTPRTAITTLPFATNFNLGKGVDYFTSGTVDPTHESNWGNLAEQDYLPSFIVSNSQISADYDFTTAYNGGTSFRVKNSGYTDRVPIYLTAIPATSVTARVEYTLTAGGAQLYLMYKGGAMQLIALPPSPTWAQATQVVVNPGEIVEIGVTTTPGSTLNLGSIELR